MNAINAVRLNQDLKGVKQARDLEIACRGNMALCKINLKQFDQAVDQCEKVLEYDPKNVKATFRMAQSIYELASGDDLTTIKSALTYADKA
mmetsp:Transcript_73246/g.101621  ORF Transcript_73246/g.101621 Transcript_73246/m.101621 type:complete len:91 (+) Transcript_73246:509-781(+)